MEKINIKKIYSCYLNYNNSDNKCKIKYFNNSKELHKFVDKHNKDKKVKKYIILSDGDYYINMDDVSELIRYDKEILNKSDDYIKDKYNQCNIYLKYKDEFHTGYVYPNWCYYDLFYNIVINGIPGYHSLNIKWTKNINHQDKYIYFIQEESSRAIKIGVSCNVKTRLATLQISNPNNLILLKFIKGDHYLEKQLHDRFNKYNIKGEWFKQSEELLDYINNLTD